MKTNIMNKKGMTLIELLVYMALAVLLLAPIIMLMNSSSKNMTRDAVNTNMRMTGRDVLNIMFDDIKNTGFKIMSVDGTVNDDIPNSKNTNDAGIVLSYGDSSSFVSVDGGTAGPYDALTLRKGVLDIDGNWLGYDVITFSVNTANKTLIRDAAEYRTNAAGNPDTTKSTITLARNVDALQFRYSDDLVKWADVCATGANGCVNVDTSGVNFNKKDVQFIRIYLVVRENKKVGAIKKAPAITVANHTVGEVDSPIVRERYEMVVPIPNNGLFP